MHSCERAGVETKVPLDEVEIGDTVICGPGELIPVDSTVSHGDAAADQASLAGESLPVPVRPGSAVLSGSVIYEGQIRIRVEQVGAATSMDRINRFLETALRTRSEGEERRTRLADRLVPLTFATSLGVLDADPESEPCRLGADGVLLLRHQALQPGDGAQQLYAASRAEVLFKGAQALESLERVDTLMFDKTGTLTSGDRQVADLSPFGDLDEDGLLALAAGAEEHYDHPFARCRPSTRCSGS